VQSDFGCNPTQTILDECCAGLLVYYSTPTTIAWPLPPTVYYYSLHIRRACRAIACARSESTCLSRSTGSQVVLVLLLVRSTYIRSRSCCACASPSLHDTTVCSTVSVTYLAPEALLAPTFGRISLPVCHGPGTFVPPSIRYPFRAARHGHRPMRPGWSGAFA
jgi:hypothetical protein